MAYNSGWSLDYVLELELLTIFNLLNPEQSETDDKPIPKKRKVTQLKDELEKVKMDFAEFDRRVQRTHNKALKRKQSENQG